MADQTVPTREQVRAAMAENLPWSPQRALAEDAVMALLSTQPTTTVLLGGVVVDSGGGEVRLVVDRDTEHYPEPGTHVVVTRA